MFVLGKPTRGIKRKHILLIPVCIRNEIVRKGSVNVFPEHPNSSEIDISVLSSKIIIFSWLPPSGTTCRKMR